MNFYSMQMHHHHLVNALRSRVFQPANTPANTGMQVAANPANALMQVAAIGFVPEATGWHRSIIRESAVSQAMSAYDLGVQIGPFLFTGDFVPGSKKLQRAIATYEDVPGIPQSLRPSDLMRGSHEETIRSQTWFLYENIRDVLEENDSKLEDIVKLRVYLVDMADAASFAEIHAAFFGSHHPVVTFATAVKLGRPEFRVAIEVTAVVSRLTPDARLKPRFLADESSKKVFGAGSVGVAAGPYIFLGNSTASSPRLDFAAEYEKLPEPGVRPGGGVGMDFVAGPAIVETWQALQHGSRLLKGVGASISDAVSLTVYLLSMGDLPAVDRVLRHVFPARPPAVTVIQVPEMPVRGSRVEIEITAYKE
jgi:enamine deaminase RidA (YjgF/YER057c/UK114 family)